MLSVTPETQTDFKSRFSAAPAGPIWEQILLESLKGLRTGAKPDLEQIVRLSGNLLEGAGSYYTVALTAGQLWARPILWFGVGGIGDKGRWADGGDVPPGHLLPENFVLPSERIPLNELNIWNLLRSLIPIEKALAIMPHIWSEYGLTSTSIDEHVSELLELATIDPNTADLIFRGEVIAAETLLLSTKWLSLVRRTAAIWLVADLFRTGLLVRAINDNARRLPDLGNVLLHGEQSEPAGVKKFRRPWLRNGSVMTSTVADFEMLAELTFYPSEGKRPKYPEKAAFKALHERLENSPAAIAEQNRLKNNSVHYRFSVGKIRSRLKFHADAVNQIRRQPQKLPNSKRSPEEQAPDRRASRLPDTSGFETIVGVAPLPAIFAVAILADLALTRLKVGAQDNSKPILESVALTPWANNAAMEVKSNFKIMILMMRIQWWNYVYQQESDIDWAAVDFSDKSSLTTARAELEADKLTQTEIRAAREFIKAHNAPIEGGLGAHYDLPRVRGFLDLSMRYRNGLA
jgi:hypothetical protein